MICARELGISLRSIYMTWMLTHTTTSIISINLRGRGMRETPGSSRRRLTGGGRLEGQRDRKTGVEERE